MNKTIINIVANITDATQTTNGLLCCQNINNLYFAVNPTALGAYIWYFMLNFGIGLGFLYYAW